MFRNRVEVERKVRDMTFAKDTSEDEKYQLAIDSLDRLDGFEHGYQNRWPSDDSRAGGRINRQRWTPRQVALLERSRKQYRIGWRRGRAQWTTGLASNAPEIDLPIRQGDGMYHIEVGKADGKYKPRYTVESQLRAVRYYNCILIGNRYKKRLIGPDGALVARSFS